MTLTAVTPDIFQVQIPLPFALRIVNCYLLRGEHGWTVVDTGLNTSKARITWQEAFAELGIRPRQIEQIVLTHIHPDHYGLAGWLAEWCVADGGALPPVRLSAREAEMAVHFWAREVWQQPTYITFWQQCAVPPDLAQAIAETTEQTRQRTYPHPATHHIIEPDVPIRLGSRIMQPLLMPGHSDGQLVFYDAADRLLLCGDHVLQKITPNISLWPDGEADPLGHYLTSLEELARLEVRLALPGHGPMMENVHGRMAQIAQHHHDRLVQTEAVLDEPSTVYKVSQRLFDHDNLSVHEMRFAATETLAHLDYLVRHGRVRRHGEEVWWFERDRP
ncbi:MAG TPA: MBL fold metallo-hydrolase [Chloroflexota bacterium]|nr:MBL fold metallo-hydrolase [Chloroflexota bacterium]HUM68404.1 MBL fold metallo-hydrolase [Chloroflexota bacterium]